MAAIIQEWQAIVATAKKIAEKTGVELPRELQRMEGDVWGRQAGRLKALNGWLRQVEARLPISATLEETKEGPASKSRKKKTAEPSGDME